MYSHNHEVHCHKKQDVEKIVYFLVCKFGFPILQRRLNIYSADTDDLSIETIDCAIHFKKNSENKYINIKNKNLKQFFKYIQSHNKNGFFINDIVIFNFSVATLLFNTYHGDILSINDEQLIEEINIKFGYKCYDDINCHKTELLASSEFLFDDIGNLNKKIKNYANMTGLDIRSNSASMRIRLSNISNNYEINDNYPNNFFKIKDLIVELKQHGYIFGLCTNRPMDKSVKKIICNYELDGPLIMEGALVYIERKIIDLFYVKHI